MFRHFSLMQISPRVIYFLRIYLEPNKCTRVTFTHDDGRN